MPKKKYPKIIKKDLEEGVKKWKEENEWEEFEDYICVDGYSSVDLKIGNFEKLLNKYQLCEENVKIKARKGEIVIKKLEK